MNKVGSNVSKFIELITSITEIKAQRKSKFKMFAFVLFSYLQINVKTFVYLLLGKLKINLE